VPLAKGWPLKGNLGVFSFDVFFVMLGLNELKVVHSGLSFLFLDDFELFSIKI
jgi:hypothetical protein